MEEREVAIVRLQKELSQLTPEQYPALIILQEGQNDFYNDHDPSDIEQELRRVITFIKEKNIQVMLLGAHAKDKNVDAEGTASGVATNL
jgi:lysophospholipase L1-like esterase